MPELVCTGAQLKCTFGATPATLIVPPLNRTTSGMGTAATIMDHKPTVNIPPFGMCKSPNNPAVIAATAAASGVFTQAPCVPVTTMPWAPPNPTVTIGGQPALHKECKCMCAWAGMISITNANSVNTKVG